MNTILSLDSIIILVALWCIQKFILVKVASMRWKCECAGGGAKQSRRIRVKHVCVQVVANLPRPEAGIGFFFVAPGWESFVWRSLLRLRGIGWIRQSDHGRGRPLFRAHVFRMVARQGDGGHRRAKGP
jgi:hypothetical protein